MEPPVLTPMPTTLTTPTPDLGLLRLLQLTSPALPVGAFSYSEGLEMLVHQGAIAKPANLEHWLTQELCHGTVRLDAAVMARSHQAALQGDSQRVNTWNAWLSAARDTEELREQNWQMGRSLLRLLRDTQSTLPFAAPAAVCLTDCADPCNFAVAFGLAAAGWAIPLDLALLGYLQSWSVNLVSAAVRLVPLGQTVGQCLLLTLQNPLQVAAQEVLALSDDELASCSWGLALASMAHETQYTRLFRS